MGTVDNGCAFGPYLKTLRQKKHLKLNEVGLELKIDPTLLSKYEAGTRFPRKETFDKIASYYRVKKSKLARMIAQDKQKGHYKRLASETEDKK